MAQITLASQASFERYTKKTRREKFLEEMERIVPWRELEALVEPHYPKGDNGRPPVGLKVMLRIYFLQHWFNLSDPAAEESLYDSAALRRFAGVDLGRAPAPDETTILNFRHLLEEHDLCGAMLDAVNLYLEGRGIRIGTGTIVDASIIHAPSSDQEFDRHARPPDASDQERQSVVLRDESAHRRGLQRGPRAFAVFQRGLCGRQAHAAGLIARQRAQGVGRRRLSGPGRSHSSGRAAGTGYDQPEVPIQGLRG
jgi:IS5 family transposase